MRLILFFIPSFLLFASALFAQKDTAKSTLRTTSLFKDSSAVQLKGDTAKKVISDTAKAVAKKKHDPKKATLRSAILPGWGQIYNREYWKLPIVYGALAIPASLYVYNNNYYKWTKFAYQAVYNAQYLNDSTMYKQVNKKVLSRLTGKPLDIGTYQDYRNYYKRNKDYSLLWFLLVWGLNVADATVFGHLKDFDVSDDLTMHINPSYAPTTKAMGLSLTFNLKNSIHKPLPSF